MNASEWTIVVGSAIAIAIIYYLVQGTTEKVGSLNTEWWKK